MSREGNEDYPERQAKSNFTRHQKCIARCVKNIQNNAQIANFEVSKRLDFRANTIVPSAEKSING